MNNFFTGHGQTVLIKRNSVFVFKQRFNIVVLDSFRAKGPNWKSNDLDIYTTRNYSFCVHLHICFLHPVRYDYVLWYKWLTFKYKYTNHQIDYTLSNCNILGGKGTNLLQEISLVLFTVQLLISNSYYWNFSLLRCPLSIYYLWCFSSICVHGITWFINIVIIILCTSHYQHIFSLFLE